MQIREVNISAELKYKEALSLYSESNLSISHICERTGVGFSAFSSYLSKNHRNLILKRHNLSHLFDVKLRGKGGQTTISHYKYKDAIIACDSTEYLEYNISQIARIFNVDSASLAGQLRRHYPEIVPRREAARKQMGITINLQYGARRYSKEAYVSAIELLQSSDMTIEEVSTLCNVSHTGLREHILAYYPQITLQREKRRAAAVGLKLKGVRSGNWSVHAPKAGIIEKYESAIQMYRTTSATIEEIARSNDISVSGFRHHLRTWHPDLIVERRGYDKNVALSTTKRYKKSTSEKYLEAIARLKDSSLPLSRIAVEYGFTPSAFRNYINEHHPELLASRGRTKAPTGKTISSQSASKYSDALHLYATTSESLISISRRLGLTYNSVSGYIRRNYPELIEQHKTLLLSSAEKFKPGIEMLMHSNATINAVMKEYGYNEYFRTYIKANYPRLLEGDRARKRCSKYNAVAPKYSSAIDHLRTSSDTIVSVAEKFGLNIYSFRKYLYKHAPDIIEQRKNKHTKDNTQKPIYP